MRWRGSPHARLRRRFANRGRVRRRFATKGSSSGGAERSSRCTSRSLQRVRRGNQLFGPCRDPSQACATLCTPSRGCSKKDSARRFQERRRLCTQLATAAIGMEGTHSQCFLNTATDDCAQIAQRETEGRSVRRTVLARWRDYPRGAGRGGPAAARVGARPFAKISPHPA